MNLKFTKIGANKYLLPKTIGMKADVIIYGNENIIKSLSADLSLQQLIDSASLPQVISPIIAMPDVHQGFGLPIGGVMATNGLLSVGAVGMDINCGVRLLVSSLEFDPKIFTRERLHLLMNQIERLIPVGLGGKHKHKVNLDLKRLCEEGVEYLVKQGFTPKLDLEKIEEYGRMKEANFDFVTERAKNRTLKQVGTLGSGNHFIEIQKIEEIFDEDIAQKWGLHKHQICIMVHSGSRALGQQTCLDYTHLFWKAREKYHLQILKMGLASLPMDSDEAQQYFQAMCCAVNFAFCNRSMMTYYLRQIFKKNFNSSLNLLYDVAHNIAKYESFNNEFILVHRKGATRALPAKHPKNPKIYQETGHPAIIPGSMGTASYIMVGLTKNKETFYSINHGAGRLMSRSQAKRTIKEQDFAQIMKNIVYNRPFYLLADEAPQAYKNIEEIIEILVEAGLTKKIVKLTPLAVIKGS